MAKQHRQALLSPPEDRPAPPLPLQGLRPDFHLLDQHRPQPSRRVFDQVLSLRMEGLSIAAIARLTGLSWNTVSRWLERAAQAAHAYNHDRLRHFELTELQADEMRTFVPAKKRPTWIYTTMEVWSRLWPVTRVGRRGYRATLAVLRALADRALPGAAP